MPTLTTLKRTLYILKRRYGFPLECYKELKQDLNLTTGKATLLHTKQTIKRAICLPDNISYFNSAIRINAGNMEVSDKIIIIDAKDLTEAPELYNYVIFEQVRYEIRSIVALTGHVGYILNLKKWTTSTRFEIFDLCVHQKIIFSQELEHE